MVYLADAIGPDELERYVVHALGGGPPIGYYHEAWHILLPTGQPALVIFRHIHSDITHLHRLYELLQQSGIGCGYLITPKSFSEEIRQAARILPGCDIRLMERTMVEDILIQHFEKQRDGNHPSYPR